MNRDDIERLVDDETARSAMHLNATRSNESCPDPRWEPSARQIAEAFDDQYMLSRGYRPVELRRVPIRQVKPSLIPFRTREYAPRYMDDKGGPRYVRQLARLMCSHVPLPPARGYDTTYQTARGPMPYVDLTDGHHRTNAAIVNKMPDVPVVIWEHH